MQTPALPELAHTRTRPVHWVATAAAMAAVVAGAGLLQPQRAAGTAHAAPGPAPSAPDPTGVDFPLDCHGFPEKITARAAGDLDGDGRPETVAAVRCDAGSGTPPHGIYVLTRETAENAHPRVVATLLTPAKRQIVTALAVRDGAVTAQLSGYSSLDVPRCCPDLTRDAAWRWTGTAFLESDRSEPATSGSV
ncbi:hypothetical protein [Streptomyces sp. NRRL S-87]|uniref:hypothetical protein n=1 Tax=Streptomyces sp. NRRL S-87 TaxID=1463920 RepID=UPI0004C1688E|nr:hypothetical protein [Streptomyces sp. NRRL S-87]